MADTTLPQVAVKQPPQQVGVADRIARLLQQTDDPGVVAGGLGGHGALAVPLITPLGCEGVLAIELPEGREHAMSLRALAYATRAAASRNRACCIDSSVNSLANR